MDKNACFRNIPKVDVLLEDPAIIALCDEYGRDIAVDCIRSCTDDLRAFISSAAQIHWCRISAGRRRHSLPPTCAPL